MISENTKTQLTSASSYIAPQNSERGIRWRVND